MNIYTYTPTMEQDLFALIASEGEEWHEYLYNGGKEKYLQTLASSITLVAYEEGKLIGYARAIVDGAFHVYVCDLLVHKQARGHKIGRKLMTDFYERYPSHVVLVMSDVDMYYEKLGYQKEGTIFTVSKPSL
ncbi:GNAT family N-acetyltransferase [Shouchella sp. 1P09AA]|uniref:GNAT family N-acetyltransferase n=1 Tax=unclassified Shouchella TaxID=2893065 RepID=UPI0039A1A6A5